MIISCRGIKSHMRQNASISAGVPDDTHMYLFIAGMGGATNMLFFFRCAKTSSVERSGLHGQSSISTFHSC